MGGFEFADELSDAGFEGGGIVETGDGLGGGVAGGFGNSGAGGGDGGLGDGLGLLLAAGEGEQGY